MTQKLSPSTGIYIVLIIILASLGAANLFLPREHSYQTNNFRDWEAITAWAADVAEVLQEADKTQETHAEGVVA